MSAARVVLALVLTAVKVLAVKVPPFKVPLVLMLVLHHLHQLSSRNQMFTPPTRQ
jgi:hypothetical protein